jgi:hypothetical protein
VSGPFFLVGYLDTVTDLAGTTKNDIIPTVVVDVYLRDPTIADVGGNTYSRSRVVNA